MDCAEAPELRVVAIDKVRFCNSFNANASMLGGPSSSMSSLVAVEFVKGSLRSNAVPVPVVPLLLFIVVVLSFELFEPARLGLRKKSLIRAGDKASIKSDDLLLPGGDVTNFGATLVDRPGFGETLLAVGFVGDSGGGGWKFVCRMDIWMVGSVTTVPVLARFRNVCWTLVVFSICQRTSIACPCFVTNRTCPTFISDDGAGRMLTNGK